MRQSIEETLLREERGMMNTVRPVGLCHQLGRETPPLALNFILSEGSVH